MTTDELTQRNLTLSDMSWFPSFSWYADEWEKLAADMEAAGRFCTAENCRNRARHYRSCAETHQTVICYLPGGQVRLVETDAAESGRGVIPESLLYRHFE